MDSNNKLEVSSQPSAAWSSLNPPHYGSHYDVTQRDFQQSWQHYNYPPDSHFGLSNDVQNMYGNDISHQQSLHSSTFMSTPSNAGHTTFLTHSVAPRVHINPNYRPKGPPPTRKNSKRTLSVHVNPHWKGRLEPSASGEESISVKSDNSAPSSKKTIFVNPKVLAQIKMTAPKSSGGGPSVCVKTVNSSNNFSSNFHSQPEGKMKAAEDFSMAEKMKVDQEIIKEEVKTLCVQPPTIPMPSFSKLIQRSSTSSDPKQSILNQVNIQKPYCSRILKPVPEKAGVKSVNPAYHSLKIAKQVCSKYKLVHNASSIISKLTNCTPADTPGRLRRKSLNSKLSFQLKPKSAYKFVRTPTQSNDSCLHSKAQKSSRKNLKTRFKLVKIQTHQQGKSGGPETINPKTVKSRYKLVHLDSLQGKLSSRNVPRGLHSSGVLSLPQQSPLIRSRYKFVRGISVNKVKQARKVSRFRIVQSSSSPRFKANNSPLKILRRTPQTLTFSNPLVKGHGLYGNRIWRKEAVMLTSSLKANPSSPSPVHSSKSRRNALMYNKIYSRNLLNIGGVYYRSTPTSLTRTHSAKLKESIVCIRGKRFILDEKGTTLRPAFGPGASIDRDSSRKRQLSFDRVDFGGITFMKGSGNTLVRTNHHYTRNILSNAKMRSIALLRGKLSKNNQPCLIYHRFGKCHGHEEGKCWRVHDPKNIAICPKFLQGACNADMCLLSHDIGPEKMPTCRFFLEGCCVRDNCPYLHVKLSAHAPICRQFLHGYCSAGNKCKKRHVYLCPDFDQDGKCCKGKRCPYPHKSKDRKVLQREARNYRKEGLRKTRGESEKKPNECQTVSSYNGETEKRKRYYDNSPFGTETKSSQENEAFNVECEFFDNVSPSSKRANDSQNELVDERSPIGALPAYIPLE